MRPDSFHLKIGMSRTEALTALETWAPKPGKNANEVVVDYSDDACYNQFTVDQRERMIGQWFAFRDGVPTR